ncbi:MAG: bifunctional hydroxymethylpyrimidine kinase/phosphomethylpyrimidine kinase [Myxococcota bacterium]|nr:bifunctional hydroxymethylpyrimidine kinase/phosphomethylpyrimidine kinase [Myxococcota bacterium]
MVATALSIAGSDPSGGAGLQADLKTFVDHGVYGMAVPTALTVQNTLGVGRVHLLDPDLVQEQVSAVLSDLEVGAIKVGMLGSADTVEATARALQGCSAPLVLDPVLRSSSGTDLLDSRGRACLIEALLPRATIWTPNGPEWELLAGGSEPSSWVEERGVALLLTDGHGEGPDMVDRLFVPGHPPRTWRHPRQQSRNTHGTGCTLSASIAARLAQGEPLAEAARGAVAYVAGLLLSSRSHTLGEGTGPLLHGLKDGR